MKKEKKKRKNEMDDSLSKRAEAFIYEEIRKSIMGNPILMGQLMQSANNMEKVRIEAD